MEQKKNLHTLGICAMAKKAKSKQMQAILNNLRKFGDFELIIFPEKIILEEEIEKWPKVESLIIFFSTGFPYKKALEYINLTKPFLVNDFEIQNIFWDRRRIKRLLKQNHIPTPYGIIIDRGEEINNDGESDSTIPLNTSAEIEKMIDEYNSNVNNSNTEIKKNSINSIRDTDLIEKANKEEYYIDDDYHMKRTLSITSRKSSSRVSLSPSMNQRKYSQDPLQNEEITEDDDDDFYLDDSSLEEFDEYIIYKGKKIDKPFVEKPANGDDHNVYIYYPQDGGQKRLFRKTKNLSSLYYPNENRIRRDKSYIYEAFLQSDGFDVKVYTVGEDYAHAEARKSPTLDGLVQRASNGKEVRFPINLTKEEKEIARKIVKIFKQNVCGFDIIRAGGKSYVCDVNGWSFVKGNKKYYEDCAIQIRKIILNELDPNLLFKTNLPFSKVIKTDTDYSIKPQEELRSIIGIFRNADRAPKEEIQIIANKNLIFDLYYKYMKKNNNYLLSSNNENWECPGEIKLKKRTELLDVLDTVNKLLSQKGINEEEFVGNDNFYVRLWQVKIFLERNPNFEGMTRKILLRPLKWETIKEVGGTNLKNNGKYKITEILMIMKWGGHITHSGIEQAKQLGKKIRSEFYPGEDLLRLHSSYRHDLIVYSCDEGRCLKSAASFLQGLLEFDGSLIPIITSMIRKGESVNYFLDINLEDDPRDQIKNKLKEICNFNGKLIEKYKNEFGEKNFENYLKNNNKESQAIIDLINSIDNFYEQMNHVYQLIYQMKEHFKHILENKKELSREINSYFVMKKSTIENNKKKETFNNIQQSFFELNKKIKKKNKKKQKIKSMTPDKKDLSPPEAQKKLSDQKLNYIAKSLKKKDDNNKKKINIVNNDCEEENVIMKLKRYMKLYENFYNKETKQFDISRLIDIIDNIKYDLIHNKSIMNDKAYELYETAKKLSSFVISLEFGITPEQKNNISKIILRPLLKRLKEELLINESKFSNSNNNNPIAARKTSNALDYMAENNYSGLNKNNINDNDNIISFRHVKTRFYFTTYPHLYMLLNSLKGEGLIDNKEAENKIWKIFDLDYCSYIVFRVFENFEFTEKEKNRYRVEIMISSGADNDPKCTDSRHMIPASEKIVLNNQLSLDDLRKYFNIVLSK